MNKLIDAQTCRLLCTCGSSHPEPNVRVLIDENALDILAGDIDKDESVLVIDDENTHAVAGADLVISLNNRQVKHRVITLAGDVDLKDRLADKISLKCNDISLIIVVGAGTVNDLGKYVSTQKKIPYWTVPTAPSMNGYTSSIAAVKVDGVKRTLPAVPPGRVYAVPRIIRESPLRLRQAGFCDVLAKSVSDTDWQTESLLFKGTYCRLPTTIVAQSEHEYIHDPEKIREGHETTITGLLNGLLISGIAMSLAGSSAPASGGEHLISHVLDMREPITGRKPDLHGLQVAAGIVFSSVCYDMLADLQASDLKPLAEKQFQEDADQIQDAWGPLADEVKKQFLKKHNRLLQFDTLLPDHWDKLKPLCASVRKPSFFLDLIRCTGFEMTLSAIHLDQHEFLLTAKTARTIRDRITVLDVAAHAGILEPASEKTVCLLSG